MLRIDSNLRRWGGVLGLCAASTLPAGCAQTISTQQEVQLGAQYAAEINRQLPIVQDAQINRYINSLGDRIAAGADSRGIDYRFFVVNSDQVNAFAVPGGYVYVNRGLIERTANMSELAGVLGHEIAHVSERHGVEQMARMQQTQLGVNLAYVLLGRQPSGVEQAGVQLGAGAFFAKHSRKDENEADSRGVRFVTQAGINPQGMVSFFQTLLREQQRSPSSVEQWFSTHPTTQDRIDHTQQEVSAVLASRGTRGLATNSNDYSGFKSRVSRLPAAPRS